MKLQCRHAPIVTTDSALSPTLCHQKRFALTPRFFLPAPVLLISYGS